MGFMSGNAGNVWKLWKCLETLEMSGNSGNVWKRWKEIECPISRLPDMQWRREVARVPLRVCYVLPLA
jgi:hypothetical protein